MTTALVIEDNENNMELITFILNTNGVETVMAKNGQEGIEMALSLKPDFIILDIQLPDIDGTEVLELLRATEVGKIIPVIAMTSYAMAGDREKLLKVGCNGYIEKPIDPENVMAQIQQTLAKTK